jgi:hypothetical protein
MNSESKISINDKAVADKSSGNCGMDEENKKVFLVIFRSLC